MLYNNYFDDIDDMVLHNWRKCQDGDLTYTRRRKTTAKEAEEKRVWYRFLVSVIRFFFFKKQTVDAFKYTEEADQEAWDRVYDSYIVAFGHGEDWNRIYELREEIALLQCDFVINGNNFLRNKIQALVDELHEFLNREVEGDMDDCLVTLGKWMGKGGPLNDREITVRGFYKMMHQFNKYVEESNSNKAS